MSDLSLFIEETIGTLNQKRVAALNALTLPGLLELQNPCLFSFKHVQIVGEMVKRLVDAHISSNEVTVFGDWLEGLAIFINEKVYGGWKSGIAVIPFGSLSRAIQTSILSLLIRWVTRPNKKTKSFRTPMPGWSINLPANLVSSIATTTGPSTGTNSSPSTSQRASLPKLLDKSGNL